MPISFSKSLFTQEKINHMKQQKNVAPQRDGITLARMFLPWMHSRVGMVYFLRSFMVQ